MRVSCGLLMYARAETGLAVLLAHPGGPFWRGKDKGAWSIPKGLAEPDEPLLDAAQREFREETGLTPKGPFLPLPPCRQRSGKIIHCWAFAGDGDLSAFKSGDFEMEWPPRSGARQSFPEVDEIRLFPLDQAKTWIHPGQKPLIDAFTAAYAAGLAKETKT